VKFRFHQATPKGLWISRGVFEEGYDEIVAQVRHGYVPGEPRAAIEEDTERVIFAWDGCGAETTDWHLHGAVPPAKASAS
jgi:hypothetical protein